MSTLFNLFSATGIGPGFVKFVLSDLLSLDLPNNPSEALRDFEVSPDGNVAKKFPFVDKVRCVLRLVNLY